MGAEVSAMARSLLVVLALLTLGGCAGSTLPYTPATQPAGATLSAGYRVVGDRLQIEVDTDGRRLEEATVVRADGTAVRPTAIDVMPGGWAGGPHIGVGVGGGTWGGGGIGVGTGVSVGVPAGGTSDGNTLVYFPLDQVGAAPWLVRVRVHGVPPTLIPVGTPAAQ
jgi:hypothetical protein